jgi:hypothetical protein
LTSENQQQSWKLQAKRGQKQRGRPNFCSARVKIRPNLGFEMWVDSKPFFQSSVQQSSIWQEKKWFFKDVKALFWITILRKFTKVTFWTRY